MTAEVRKAFEDFGCFEAVYKLIPSKVHKDMYGALDDLFDLPSETKMKSLDKLNPAYSYIGPHPLYPLVESLGIGSAASIESVQRFTTLMWPEGRPTFCNIVHSYVHQLLPLEQMIKKMTFESFGVEKYCPSSESTDCLLRFNAYTPSENETNGLNAHTNKSMFTILQQNNIHGLEVQTKNGEWLTATPSPDSFMVISGDAFLAWSNGRLYNPLHRVTMHAKEKRYSLVLFIFTKGIIETPEELVDEEHPLLFKPIHFLDSVRSYYSEESKIEESTLEKSCGV